jgi:hypothetical protein
VSYARKRSNLGPKIEKGLHFLDYRVIYFLGPKSNFLLPLPVQLESHKMLTIQHNPFASIS